jgi:uncharacterized membrane protein
MNKTKLGISTNLMAALVFMLAIVTTFVSSDMSLALAFVLVVAYILLLAIKALKGQTVKIPVVDKMVAKHIQ